MFLNDRKTPWEEAWDLPERHGTIPLNQNRKAHPSQDVLLGRSEDALIHPRANQDVAG